MSDSSHVYIKLLAPERQLLPTFTLATFAEAVIDLSPHYQTTSAIAKAAMLLTALSEAKDGVAKVGRASWQLMVDALNAEGEAAVRLDNRRFLGHELEDAEGKKTWVPLAARAYHPYTHAFLSASSEPPKSEAP